MENSKFKALNFRFLSCVLCFAFCWTATNAQSVSIDYPTAVSINEISGQIPARDIGDARLTSYYYTFNGAQGDVFINVSTTNFNGDIDVYIAEGLRPVTKITFYADASVSETGRVLYLRKLEKLILRVQGRPPDDNAATFKIKFAGSFVAVADTGTSEELKLPEVNRGENGTVRVNSVGTIIEPLPKKEAQAKEAAAESVTETTSRNEPVADDNQTETSTAHSAEKAKQDESSKPAAAAVEESSTKESIVKPAAAKRSGKGKPARSARNKTKTTASAPKAESAEPLAKIAPPNPLENIRLVVVMKDGEKFEFAMSDVFRFTMNNGVLLIITKDGKSHRRSLLDVQKLTVE